MRNITLEEAWGPLWREGYKFQFEGDLKRTHEKVKLVGRAVTSVMVPMRPDPVSYTHLDVYKRQVLNPLSPLYAPL